MEERDVRVMQLKVLECITDFSVGPGLYISTQYNSARLMISFHVEQAMA